MQTGRPLGLLLLDIDHFKHVNDTLGHPAGDHLLRTFAERVRSALRAGDFVARLGGDEFAIVLEGMGDRDDLVRIGEGIARRLKTPLRWEGRAISAGASIGGAVFPADAASANELLKNADTALYALKAEGRGGTKMFHTHMRASAQLVASQLSLGRFAVAEEACVPHYQPKVRLLDGTVAGFEALLRWQHPHRGLQLPTTIAESFKDYQLASAIGDQMQVKVAKDLAKWRAAGLDFGRVSINAAPAEFLRDDYSERLLARLDEAGLPPHFLEVEVTEHVFLESGREYVARALARLTDAGVRIALDDFGTGYSSLSHLRDFPVDVVKIDRSFVSGMVEDEEIAAIVTAVVELARSLSIEVVGEGVETEAQRRFLIERGCDVGQGYLFGRAADEDQVRTLLRRPAADPAPRRKAA
jgi:diguanylate cyclase (GGDEF)-like protein